MNITGMEWDNKNVGRGYVADVNNRKTPSESSFVKTLFLNINGYTAIKNPME